MKAKELFNYFYSRAHWVDPSWSCDAIRWGDENEEVIRVGTGWIDCVDNLKAAAADGCNVFISHEIPFTWERNEDVKHLPWYQNRVKILEDSGMVLMNLHDTWDHYPEIGVRDALAKLLGLGELLQELDYLDPHDQFVTNGKNSIGIYRICPTTAGEFAQKMCDALASVKVPGLCLNGDPMRPIETVAIGVGCHVPSLESVCAGAQLLVDVYDRHKQQTSRIPLADSGIPVITIEHSAAETYSMQLMAQCIKNELGIDAKYYNLEPVGVYYTPTNQ